MLILIKPFERNVMERFSWHFSADLIDCMNFRRNKDEELRRMVTLLIDRAKATGELQEIGPLNPYARRIVHLKVAEDPTMESESIGDAFLKSVVISVRDS